MKTNPVARLSGRKSLNGVANGRRTSITSRNNPIPIYSDPTATKPFTHTTKTVACNPLTPWTSPFTSASAAAAVSLAHHFKKPPPILGGSPIKRRGRRSRRSSFSSQTSAILQAAGIDQSPNDPITNETAASSNVEASTDGIRQDTQAVINANNAPYLTDPGDEDCPVDLTKIYIDANGQFQSTQFLLPPPISTMGASAYQDSALNYTRRLNYGMTRTGAERFTAMAMNQQPIRLMSSKAELSTEQYHQLADEYIDSLVLMLEGLQDENEAIEVEYSAGVLTLTYPPHGTYVINKQPPNKQIWLSSPISGPFRFDYREVQTEDFSQETIYRGKWVDRREGTSLSALLEKELQEVLPLEGEDRKWDPETKRFEQVPRT